MPSDLSLRVPVDYWLEDDIFGSLKQMFLRRTGIRDVIFFTDGTSVPLPLPEMARRAAILKRRIAEMRSLGFGCHINVLATLGHCDENLKWTSTIPGRLFTSIDGKTCPGNICPRDQEWRRNYIIPLYRMLAETAPDVIWMDDDIRLTNHGTAPLVGCFCDECMEDVRRFTGFQGTREELMAWTDDGGASQEILRQRRLKLLEWARSVLTDILTLIEKTVHGVNPDIIIGKMDCFEPWENDRMVQGPLLQGPHHRPVYWRPGGGFYTDDNLHVELTAKLQNMGNVIASLPPCATSVQCELETFTFPRLGKSISVNNLETSAYCAVGATGTLLNILLSWGGTEDTLQSKEKLLQALDARKPFNDRIVDLNAGLPPCGIWDGCDNNFALGQNERAPHWLDIPSYSPAWGLDNELARLGLPLSFSQENAVCAALSAVTARSLSDEQLLAILSSAAYLDDGAVRVLNERGFGQYVGFKCGCSIPRDAIERTLNHPLNSTSFTRNLRQRPNLDSAVEMIPLSPKCEALTRLIDYEGDELVPCTCGCFVNELGGRVAVSGYGAWKGLGYSTKYRQMHSIFRWLTQDHLPAEIPDCEIWAMVIPRRRLDGSLGTAIINLSFDGSDSLPVTLQTTASCVRLIRPAKPDEILPLVPSPTRPGQKDCTVSIAPLEVIYLETVA